MFIRILVGVFLVGQLINARFRRNLGYVSCITILLLLLNFYIWNWNPEVKVKLDTVCLSSEQLRRDLRKHAHKLLTAPFHHLNEFHLTFSILSFMSKANYLEFRAGSGRFLYGLIISLIFTSLTSVFLHYLMNDLMGISLEECMIGFSGLTFALKVWTIHDWTKRDDILEVHLFGLWPVRPEIGAWILWFEFFIPLFLTTQSTMITNISGILVGLIYIHLLI